MRVVAACWAEAAAAAGVAAGLVAEVVAVGVAGAGAEPIDDWQSLSPGGKHWGHAPTGHQVQQLLVTAGPGIIPACSMPVQQLQPNDQILQAAVMPSWP
jgi:hypothetical protein